MQRKVLYIQEQQQDLRSVYNYRVKVTKKNYKLYKNFKWKKSKTKVYKKTYVAKYRYDHKNGNKYLALYTKGGNLLGILTRKQSNA